MGERSKMHHRQMISLVLILIFTVIAQLEAISKTARPKDPRIVVGETVEDMETASEDTKCKIEPLMTIKFGQYGFRLDDGCDLGAPDCNNLEPVSAMTEDGDFITSVLNPESGKNEISTIVKLNPDKKTATTFSLAKITDNEFTRVMDIRTSENKIKVFYAIGFDPEKQAFKNVHSVVLDPSLKVLRSPRKEQHFERKRDASTKRLKCDLTHYRTGVPSKLGNHYYSLRIGYNGINPDSFQLIRIHLLD
jgi:hypothetical protein